MSGLLNALAIVAVAALVSVRQFRAGRLDTGRRWWLGPAILVIITWREPGPLDPHHHVASGLLLGAELLVGLAVGAGWAWTTRIWREADGAVWTRSTRGGVIVWFAGIALRVGLFDLGAILSVQQNSSGLLLALAATPLARSGIMAWRAQSPDPVAEGGAAYGAGMTRLAWKEGV